MGDVKSVIVEHEGQKITVRGTAAKMIALIAAKYLSWNLEAEGVVTVHLRSGDGWLKDRVEHEGIPIRDEHRPKPMTG